MRPSASRYAALVAIGVTLWLTTPGVGFSLETRPPASSADALRARGLQLGYNLDHQEALAAFREAIAQDPRDPRAHTLAAGTIWTQLLFEQGAVTVDDYLGQARSDLTRATPNPTLAAAFRDELQQATTLAEQRLRANPADADAHYRVGAAYGFLASYTATVDGRVLGSLGPARRAYAEHSRALVLDPQRRDAGLVLGLYGYAVSELSAPARFFAHLVGLSGFGTDRAKSLHLVEDAAAYPSEVQPNASFTLILLYTREARYDDALRVITRLQGLFPRNRLLWLEAGHAALRAGRPADAKSALEEGLARLARDPRPRALGEDARWRYAHGAALVALKEVGPAEQELRAALNGAARDWVRGRIHRELGKLADLSANRARAVEEYRIAEQLCQKDHDNECADGANALIKTRYR